ncbi:MAG: NAD-dependent epimerase/dehydratase family protein [Chloroflexi bacterium]|nr:NAD-dependent epimerase/dehydratase family protein [Chloroflexota bacterium]
MRVLLISATGFLGNRIISWLQRRGHDVILYHPEHRDHLLKGIDAQRVFGYRIHFDEQTKTLDQLKLDAAIDCLPWNDKDTLRVISGLHGRAKRVVHLSGMDVYRAWSYFHNNQFGEPIPISEHAPSRGGHHPMQDEAIPALVDYDKLLAERVILNAHFSSGYPGTIVRLPRLYGPQDPRFYDWQIVRRMVAGHEAIFMEGCQSSWLQQRGFVDNVALGIALVAERDVAVGQIYNIGDEETLTRAGWIKAMGEALRWEGEIIIRSKQDLPEHLRTAYNYQQHLVLDTTKIRRQVGYTDTIPPAEAIRRTTVWMAQNLPDHLRLDDAESALEGDLIKKVKQEAPS